MSVCEWGRPSVAGVAAGKKVMGASKEGVE